MTDEKLGPSPWLTDAEWRLINPSSGKPRYRNQREAKDDKPVVDIVHSFLDGDRVVQTYNPRAYRIVTMLVGNPPRRVDAYECDVYRFHGGPCADRSQRFKADRRS